MMMMIIIIIVIIQNAETFLYCYVVICIHYIRSEKKFAHFVHCVILCLKDTLKFYTTYVLRCLAFVTYVTN